MVLALFLAGCSLFNMPEEDTRLRLRNETGYELTQVTVASPGLEERFDRIPAGGTTEYRRVARLYRYAYVEATVNGRVSRIMPIDYVGETPLGSGSYTFVLGLTDMGELGFRGVVRDR